MTIIKNKTLVHPLYPLKLDVEVHRYKFDMSIGNECSQWKTPAFRIFFDLPWPDLFSNQIFFALSVLSHLWSIKLTFPVGEYRFPLAWLSSPLYSLCITENFPQKTRCFPRLLWSLLNAMLFLRQHRVIIFLNKDFLYKQALGLGRRAWYETFQALGNKGDDVK